MRAETSTSLCYSHAQLMTALFCISRRRFRLSTALLASVMSLLASACSLIHSGTVLQTKAVDEVLVDGPRGTVLLQKAEDGWFGTAHPLSLSPIALASVFRGVHVKMTMTGKAEEGPVFSDEDIEFLSPLISTALSKATKRQVVGFRVSHVTDAGNEKTGGILYVQGRLLHLTFTHYRAQQERLGQTGTSPRLVPNPVGLNTRQLTFIPETAQRSSRNEQPDVVNTPALASVVIDYEELLTASVLQPTVPRPHPARMDQVPVINRRDQSIQPTGETAASRDTGVPLTGETGTNREVVREHATDLDALKEEVRSLQRQLSELNSQIQGTKKP